MPISSSILTPSAVTSTQPPHRERSYFPVAVADFQPDRLKHPVLARAQVFHHTPCCEHPQRQRQRVLNIHLTYLRFRIRSRFRVRCCARSHSYGARSRKQRPPPRSCTPPSPCRD